MSVKIPQSARGSLITSLFIVILSLAGAVSTTAHGQATQSTKNNSKAVGNSNNRPASDSLTTVIRFRFDILGMVTNHQFDGQINNFHFDYEYAAILQGGVYDPIGHAVKGDTFPYFQTVRDDALEYITHYPNSSDFYEIFGANICRHLMKSYPQLGALTLTIDIPAHGAINIDRSVTIAVTRKRHNVALSTTAR